MQIERRGATSSGTAADTLWCELNKHPKVNFESFDSKQRSGKLPLNAKSLPVPPPPSTSQHCIMASVLKTL
jgi:hypothetical protein